MKSIKKIALLVIVFMLASTLSVFAADITAEMTLTATPTTVKAGETFTVVVSAKCETGIEGVEAIVEYDKTKLELTNLEQLAATGYTSMSGFEGEDDSGNFMLAVLYVGSGTAPTESNFATLTFKALDTVAVDEALSVKLSGIELGDSDDQWTTIEDKEVTVTVAEEVQEPDNGEQNPDDGEQTPDDGEQNPDEGEQTPEPTPDNGTEQEPEQKPEQSEQQKDPTIADKPINNAGLETFAPVAMLAVVLVAIALYAKCKKYSDVK